MIVCCGEALIDFVPTPDGKSYTPCPGGSILNIAVGLGRMDIPVQFLCPLSTDMFGEILVNQLINNSVNIDLCPRVDGQTTLAFVSLPQEGDEEPQFAFYSNGAVDTNLRSDQLPENFSEDVKAMHFGSISLVLEPGATAYGQLMKRESRKRILTLDPNVRPAIIEDKAIFRKKFEGWIEYVDILRLSEVDLDYLYPDEKIESLLSSWFEKGLCLIILTQGAKGVRAFTTKGVEVFIPAQKVKIEDTVGAGDSFFSAVLTFLYDNNLLNSQVTLETISADELKKCMSFAVKAAAINCTRKGADPPFRNEMG